MNLTHLQEFVTFSQHMSIAEAAKQLHLSPSTLSDHIASLEKSLDVVLVHRERPLRLSSAGRALVNGAPNVLRACDNLEKAVKETALNELELVVAHEDVLLASHDNAMMFLQLFRYECAGVSTRLMASRASTAVEALKDEAVDCAVVLVHPIESDIEAGIVFEKIPPVVPSRLAIWMHESHPLASKDALSWSDLDGIKHPVHDSTYRMLANSIGQLFAARGITAEMGINAHDDFSFLGALADDEVQLSDESCERHFFFSAFPRRVFRIIDEPNAWSDAYLAYRPDRVRPALKLLLDQIRTRS